MPKITLVTDENKAELAPYSPIFFDSAFLHTEATASQALESLAQEDYSKSDMFIVQGTATRNQPSIYAMLITTGTDGKFIICHPNGQWVIVTKEEDPDVPPVQE